MKSKNLIINRTVIFALLICLFIAAARAQETTPQPKNQNEAPAAAMNVALQPTSFTYQGRLNDAGGAASGSFDFQFALYTYSAGGTAINTISKTGVEVTNGIFTVELDFGSAAFPDETRWLEIRVKASAAAEYTTLTPRQKITNAPFALRAARATFAENAQNALAVGGTPAANIIKEGDARLTDSRSPTSGSFNYVQNRTTQQTNTNFNISGNGTLGGTLSANVVNSATGFNIANNRVLGTNSPDNLWLGVGAGNSTMTGLGNVFVGAQAGLSNTTGAENSFVGKYAGKSNTTGFGNVFVGASTGFYNTTGGANSFVGTQAGVSNTEGNGNSFFGAQAGYRNTTGENNSFFGMQTGYFNSTGSSNSFFGAFAGSISTGSFNSFVGANAGLYNSTGEENSFFGSDAGRANTIGKLNSFVGAYSGDGNTTGSSNSFFGANTGGNNTTGGFNSFVGEDAGSGNTTGSENSFIGSNAGDANTTGSYNTIIGSDADVGAANLGFATAVGAGAKVNESNAVVLGRPQGQDKVTIPGTLFIGLYGTGGNAQLCVNTANNQIATCGSSLRYKENISMFSAGLKLVNRLRPVAFDWKSGGRRDFGLIAEEVAEVEPLLANYNKDGQIEGVKYDRIGVVLLNAVKEQQTQIERQNAQIESQNKQITQQQKQINQLREIVCAIKPDTAICK